MIYFETGEPVAALSEWVISKHFKPKDNIADSYIADVQKNPTKLENLNQAIKKYNTALSYARQGSIDLAVLQLRKVISLNPRFMRAYMLIALLYIKNGEHERAKRYLLKASRIDASNMVILRYLKEIEDLGVVSQMSMIDPTVKEKVLEVKFAPVLLSVIKAGDKEFWVVKALKKQKAQYAPFEQVQDRIL